MTDTLKQYVTITRKLNPQTLRYDCEFQFKFNSRESYLDFVKAWKAEYKAQSAFNRETTRKMKELMKNQQYAGADQVAKICGRSAARELLQCRKAAKVEAQRQYLEKYLDKQKQALTTAVA
jgi:hypothetical protein